MTGNMRKANHILNAKVWDAVTREQDRFRRVIACEHDWKEHGYGYKCCNCDEYTGTHKELNEAIKKELCSAEPGSDT